MSHRHGIEIEAMFKILNYPYDWSLTLIRYSLPIAEISAESLTLFSWEKVIHLLSD